MAFCNANALLSDGKNFQRPDTAQLRIAIISLLKTWALAQNSSLDVTPAGILTRGKDYQRLSRRDVRNAIIQSLCLIAGGTI